MNRRKFIAAGVAGAALSALPKDAKATDQQILDTIKRANAINRSSCEMHVRTDHPFVSMSSDILIHANPVVFSLITRKAFMDSTDDQIAQLIRDEVSSSLRYLADKIDRCGLNEAEMRKSIRHVRRVNK
jgi:hypothetical protein